GETRRQAASLESGRPGVITPERPAEAWGQETAAAPPWSPQGPPTQPAQAKPFQPARARAMPQAPAWQAPARPPPPQPAPAHPAPPPAGANAGGIPNWPRPPRRRRPRRRWTGLLSTLITLALAAGVWIYVYHRTHDKLTITHVAVTVPAKTVGC